MGDTVPFVSEIRRSDVDRLLEKASRRNYGKYLAKLTIGRLRGLENQVVSFDFPVTAVVGPNGGGKTTILGAAACAYDSIKPRRFFAKSGRLDESMQNWRIEYELVDRSVNQRDTFRRTASFLNSKWSRDQLQRPVVVFGVSRTVPANERAELRRCGSPAFEVDKERIARLSADVSRAVERILGRNVANYTHIKVDPRGRVTMLSGQTETGVAYSEFHFGAGESSIIRMVMQIETLEDNALILVEEIENGLHPVATVRMVEYLIDVALRKSAQAIFTTHSNDALRPLPSQAVWASVKSAVFQGKLSIESLRAITGEVDAQYAIFTEDQFSAAWVRAMLRHQQIPLDLVEVHAMSGDGTAVAVHRHHNMDPTRRCPSICFLDGDSRQLDDAANHILRLPGESPETFVFSAVMERIVECGGRLAVALHHAFEDEARVRRVAEEVRATNRDPHLLFSQIGKRLGLLPETTVRDGFLSIWAQEYADQVREIVQPIRAQLPDPTRT